ncbi:oxidoreductase [Microdochium trichocladiopsis]|uniref:Oxidoreductase n=1 Tax=Microdochium trichocladiopsis TaxID=1682393 RepID=A0A9P8Y053_9PEZI|nr:oxidoreductase [Microdochium trichocladiopsis]KAH7024823.1 oxidoreductase [Microdochium trichocladiopsis]
MEIKKPTALVTGCSEGGIGFGLVRELARRGVHVFASARSLSKMAALEKTPGITLVTLDVTSESSIEAAVALISATTGGSLTYLVNNAGTQIIRPFLDTSLAEVRKMFDVNVFGVAAGTQAFAPLLIKAGGTVVNLASITAYMCPPYMGGYSASKAACEVLSEVMRHELKPLGVKVLTVITGAVKTNIFVNAPDRGSQGQLPGGSHYLAAAAEVRARATGTEVEARLGSVEDFARELVEAMVRGKSGLVKIGNMSAIIPFLSSNAPAALFDYLAERDTGLDKVLKPVA